MQIVGVQLDTQWHDAPANRAKVAELLGSSDLTVQTGALIVLPEMFSSGFTNDVKAATHEQTQTISFLSEVARRFSANVVAGVASRSDDDGIARNAALCFDVSGRIVATFEKLNLFPLSDEPSYYRAGTDVVMLNVGEFTAAPFVCFDLRFPEPFRKSALTGADLFIVVANWPASRVEHWLTLLRARAIENQAFVVGVNRVGRDPGAAYIGRSVLVDPMGTIRADAGDHEGLLVGTLQQAEVVEVRRRFPFLAGKTPR